MPKKKKQELRAGQSGERWTLLLNQQSPLCCSPLNLPIKEIFFNIIFNIIKEIFSLVMLRSCLGQVQEGNEKQAVTFC